MQPLHWSDRSLAAFLWLPVSWLYYFIVRLRMMTITPIRFEIPVICIGNNNVGGTGKTPTAIAVSQWLIGQGYNPHFISRGYRGHYTGTMRVNPELHIAQEVGDEPLLLAQHAPCWVSKRRLDAARAAQKAGANVIIMDDGLQNPSLHKDYTIMVVDAPSGIGNGWMLPAGPCREPLWRSVAKSNALLLVGEPLQPRLSRVLKKIKTPVFTAALAPLNAPLLQKMKVHPFAGIGHPDKFFATIEAMGAEIALCSRFADHHYYTQADMDRLIAESTAHQAQLVTTQKDAMRLPDDFLQHVLVVPVELKVEDEQMLLAAILKILSDVRPPDGLP